jgi:hypothetical protein
LGLLLRHAEHNAGQAGARARPDERRGELVPEVEAPDQPQVDEHPQASIAWDAWDDAHPDARDAADLHRALADAGAEKSAAPAPDVRAQDAWSLRARWPEQPARQGAAVELCTPDVVRSAGQSCAAPEAVVRPPLQAVPPDAARPLEPEVRQMQLPKARRAKVVRPLLAQVASRDAAVRQRAERLKA